MSVRTSDAKLVPEARSRFPVKYLHRLVGQRAGNVQRRLTTKSICNDDTRLGRQVVPKDSARLSGLSVSGIAANSYAATMHKGYLQQLGHPGTALPIPTSVACCHSM